MTIRIFIIINLFLSIAYLDELSKEQLDKIDQISQDINKAPNFSLNTVKDSVIQLDSLKGKVVLINFWATWCGPCRLEIPDFNDLYEKYNNRGFEILGISISDTKEQLVNFLKAYKINYHVLYGNSVIMQEVIADYGGVYSVPMSFLIDTEGIIQRVYPGAILRKYDPNMYTDLIYNIESFLPEGSKENIHNNE